MELAVSDDLLGTLVPIVAYWIYSGLYVLLGEFDSLDKYRLHPRSEEVKNIVSKATVVKGVLVQQASQVAVNLFLFRLIKDDTSTAEKLQPSLPMVVGQLMLAMVALDTWQYFMHRYMHVNKFLYKHIHSKHHTLVVPYAIGALYNHPLEGLILDTVGGAISFLVSGMNQRTGVFFFSFATIKTVDDHCGLYLPGNILHTFNNNSAYHDVHHQLYGSKYNFSQPFFVMWDKILGTHMPYTLEKRKEGGLEARPVKD